MFKKELDKDIAGDTSGNFAKLLLALVQVASTLTSHSSLTATRCWNPSVLPSPFQTKRDEPSNVIDYEMIDNDARVSQSSQKSLSVQTRSDELIKLTLTVSVRSRSKEEGNRCGHLDLHHVSEERPSPSERSHISFTPDFLFSV